MNYTNQCYETIAFADNSGLSYQNQPADTVTPWQYASRYFDYEIGRGVDNSEVRFVLMIRGQELRAYFTSSQRPDLKIGAFAFDMSPYNYQGGRIGLWTFAHQVQFFDFRVAPLTGANVPTQFCEDSTGNCNTDTGLCE